MNVRLAGDVCAYLFLNGRAHTKLTENTCIKLIILYIKYVHSMLCMCTISLKQLSLQCLFIPILKSFCMWLRISV